MTSDRASIGADGVHRHQGVSALCSSSATPVAQARYIGLCYGVPGVGKTMSGRHYAQWDELEAVLGAAAPPPRWHATARQRTVADDACTRRGWSIRRASSSATSPASGARLPDSQIVPTGIPVSRGAPTQPDLVLVDEADRLKTAALEQLRDMYDRRHIGLVLIGMPGLQKRLARYAQLYSRVGFVHQFHPLSGREFQTVIEHQWVQLGLDSMTATAGPDPELLNTVARITGGNFRLIQRLFAQIERRR